ncbi:MAG TPA: peptide ABC transporter substrate-binding protein [bacterium]|nr:peptide ABC transporter substrate-binding protein [bacterium]
MSSDETYPMFEQFLQVWSRRRFFKAVAASAVWAAFRAGDVECLAAQPNSPRLSAQAPAGPPRKGGQLVEGGFADVTTLNSLNTLDNVSTWIIILLGDGLLDITSAGELIPALASEVPKPSADQLTYTFKLRSGIEWSDGHPLTAEDVAFSYRLMFVPETKDFISLFRPALEQFLSSVDAPDPATIVFRLKKPWAPFLAEYGRIRIQPKHMIGAVSPKALNTHPFWSAPTVSSGPFKFVKWDKGQQVVLARNDRYWRGPALLDGYVMKLVPNAVVLAEQLRTGEVDVAQPDATAWVSLASAKNIVRKSFLLPGATWYVYNLDPTKPSYKLFGDKNVRKALQYSLDRVRIARTIYFEQAVTGDCELPSVSWAYNSHLHNTYPFNKNRAEELLDAAGWVRGADGVRAKGGTKLAFEILTNAGNKVRESILVAMQGMWKDVGVDATPRPIQNSQLVAQLTSIRTFDVMLRVALANSPDPDELLGGFFTTSGTVTGGLNGMHYSNPEVDKLIDQAAATTSPSVRKEIYARVQDLLSDDLPAAPLVYQKGVWGINKRVVGWNVGPYNTTNNRPWIKDVWLAGTK